MKPTHKPTTNKLSLFESLREIQNNNDSLNLLIQEKEEYLTSLQYLYQDIRAWLQPGLAEGMISFRTDSKQLLEELLGGPYIAPILRIDFPAAKRTIDVEPIGAFMVGSRGRVDLRCGAREYILLRLKRDSPKLWFIKEHRKGGQGPSDFSPLTEQSFHDIVAKLIF